MRAIIHPHLHIYCRVVLLIEKSNRSVHLLAPSRTTFRWNAKDINFIPML